MSSLPPLKHYLPNNLTASVHPLPLELPLKPVATKAQKYAALTKFDQHHLKSKAHFRNALKTTEGLERVARRLERVSFITSSILDKSRILKPLVSRDLKKLTKKMSLLKDLLFFKIVLMRSSNSTSHIHQCLNR